MSTTERGRRVSGTGDEFYAFTQALGEAIVFWQRVEYQHYRLFAQLIGLSEENHLASLVYHSQQSFGSRQKMVQEMIDYVLTEPQHKKIWQNINDELQRLTAERNKLAHYSYTIAETVAKQEDWGLAIDMGVSRLRPSWWNAKNAKKRDPLTPAHDLGIAAIDEMGSKFFDLAEHLQMFIAVLAKNSPNPPKPSN